MSDQLIFVSADVEFSLPDMLFDPADPVQSIADQLRHGARVQWVGQSPLVHLHSGMYQISAWRHANGRVVCEGLSDQLAIDAAHYILGISYGCYWDAAHAAEARSALEQLMDMVLLWRDQNLLTDVTRQITATPR